MEAPAPSPHLVDPHTAAGSCHCDYTRPGLEPWWEEPPANRRGERVTLARRP